jgi:hypothetical protein
VTGWIHQSDRLTIQIGLVVKEPALARTLLRSQLDRRDPCMNTITPGAANPGGVAPHRDTETACKFKKVLAGERV